VSVEQDQPQRRPGRGNGLPATAWSAVADLDPRIADDVLITLHAYGIAAYIEPTPAAVGGYLDHRLPHRLTDRLHADSEQLERARTVVAAELAESEHVDEGALLPPEPGERGPGPAVDPEEHFDPPPPPPLPRLRPTTVTGLAAIALGIVIVVTGYDGGTFNVLGLLAIVAGAAGLIWHMKDGPPPDSGWDDGAVL
jgi:hypothetical protein